MNTSLYTPAMVQFYITTSTFYNFYGPFLSQTMLRAWQETGTTIDGNLIE